MKTNHTVQMAYRYHSGSQMPLGPQSSLKKAPKLQVTAKRAKQQTSHQFGKQEICRPFAKVYVPVMGPEGNRVQSKALLPGVTTPHTGTA